MSQRTVTAPGTRLTSNEQRKRELAQIHVGKAALGWTDEDYRFLLFKQTGKSSSADLDAAGRRKLLDYMAAYGWRPAGKPFGQPEKIKWLWRKLAETHALKDTSDAALMAFVGRTAGTAVTDLKFLPVAQASTVIEALKSWLNRAQKSGDASRP